MPGSSRSAAPRREGARSSAPTSRRYTRPAGRPAALYVSRALSTSSGEDVEVVSGARFAGSRRTSCRTHRGVALLSTRGLERATRERLMTYVRDGGGLFVAAASDLEPAVLAEMTGWQPALQRRRAERTIDACRDRPAPSDLPSIWRPGREPWPGAVRPRVARRRQTAGPSSRASRMARLRLLERALGQGRVVLFASDRRPAMERLSTAPGVCPVRDRSPALRGPCGTGGRRSPADA